MDAREIYEFWLTDSYFDEKTKEELRSIEEDEKEIEIVLADRREVERILKEERVAIMCAYMLMHFLHEEDPFAFLR